MSVTWVIELGQAPVDEAQLPLLMVDHHIVWLDVSMHDAVGVAKVKSLEQFEEIVPDVVVAESGVQGLEVCVVNVLKNERRSLRHRVSNNIKKLDDILAAAQILQDLYLSLDLLLLHGLQYLHHALRVVHNIDSCKNFTVLSTANFATNFVVILITEEIVNEANEEN